MVQNKKPHLNTQTYVLHFLTFPFDSRLLFELNIQWSQAGWSLKVPITDCQSCVDTTCPSLSHRILVRLAHLSTCMPVVPARRLQWGCISSRKPKTRVESAQAGCVLLSSSCSYSSLTSENLLLWRISIASPDLSGLDLGYTISLSRHRFCWSLLSSTCRQDTRLFFRSSVTHVLGRTTAGGVPCVPRLNSVSWTFYFPPALLCLTLSTSSVPHLNGCERGGWTSSTLGGGGQETLSARR